MIVETKSEIEEKRLEAIRQRDDHFRREAEAVKMSNDLRQKYALMLGVGNGAALLALFTGMIGPNRPWELLPCGLFFLVGLLLAGQVPFALSRMFFFTSEIHWTAGARALKDFRITEDDEQMTSEEYHEKKNKQRHKWLNRVTRLEQLSGLSFALGGLLGLGLLTLKLFQIT